MARFLFQYVELLSVFGDGTPDNPGSDFSLHCWIEASDKHAALEWGYVLLGDYRKARYLHSADGYRHDGSPVREGEIVEGEDSIEAAECWSLPSCKAGEFPEWHEPWRHSNIGLDH